MQTSDVPDRRDAPPSLSGSFSTVAFFLAVVIGPLVGLVWAWTAEAVQFYVAPFLLFPLLIGVFIGLTIVGLTRFAQIGHRPTVLLAIVLAAVVAAAGQHYLRYFSDYSRPVSAASGEAAGVDLSALAREFAPSFREYIHAQATRGRPLFGPYVAKGWAAWLSWAIDAMLTLAAAVAVTIPAMRVPYCNRCRSWYRTVRNGRIDVPTAQRLAEACSVDEIPGLHSPRYRLSCCQGGCGPTRCELSWEEPSGAVDLVRVWLDDEHRNRVTAILDGLGVDE